MGAQMRPVQEVTETGKWADADSASARLYRQAQAVMPGGNSRTTVFMSPHPPYAFEGQGCWVTDVDGDRRLDCLNNYTALIHGHAHPALVEAAADRLRRGSAFALPTPEEVELAALLVERLPAVDQVRFTNSGSEAVMMAIKAARAFTGRPKIAKFEGAYHGSYDWAEVSLSSAPADWGSADVPASVPYTRGTPASVLDEVVVLPFNRPDLAARRIDDNADALAAVLLDPLPYRVGLIPARPDFLDAIRDVTRAHGILLILDEVISFRVGFHGAQGVFGIEPDLTALAKIIGGGFPVGAVGGRAEVMAVFDPRGGAPAVPHGGTFNANPVTMAAGLAAMRLLDRAAFERLDELGAALRTGLDDCFKEAGVSGGVTGVGSLFRIHPVDRELLDYRSARAEPAEAARLDRLVRRLLDHGVLMSTTGLGCLSTPMGPHEIEGFLETFAACLAQEKREGGS
jgi:glutamate-1-semialdehyde 2,1-aminomutase